jgi:hypothetical protein
MVKFVAFNLLPVPPLSGAQLYLPLLKRRQKLLPWMVLVGFSLLLGWFVLFITMLGKAYFA